MDHSMLALHLATGIAPRPLCTLGPPSTPKMKRSLPATETIRMARIPLLLLLPTTILTRRSFLAPPQPPLITALITPNLRKKRLTPLPRHGVFTSLNPMKNFLLVVATLTALPMVTQLKRHVPMAGELAKTSPLAHVAPIASLPHNPFSSATDQSLSTPPNPLLVLAGPIWAAIGLSYSAYVECVTHPMYLLALMRVWTPVQMVCLLPPPLTVAMGAKLTVAAIHF